MPRIWLMSDERLEDRLLPSIRSLPRGSGIIFRHYGLANGRRRKLFDAARRTAHRRGHIILLAGPADMAHSWGADGYHGRQGSEMAGSAGRSLPRRGGLIHSVPVHNWREIAAYAGRADLLFLSPVYATASHPDRRPLGPARFRQLCTLCRKRSSAAVIALGGITRARFQMQRGMGVYGWAAISALEKRAGP